MIDFQSNRKKTLRSLPLTPLIDITFILIIFFMLTTSFMKVESLEMILPSSGGKAADKTDVVRLYVFQNGDFRLGQRQVNLDELDETLARMFDQNKDTKMMVLTEEGVTMQQLVNAMDRIYISGGQSVFVRKWVGAK